MTKLTALILGGGRGTRLEPLTKIRSKPAVPIAGKFRLIDVPISNCLHSDIRRIFILTQFNTESLHRHIHMTYRFDNFNRGYIRILAAQQTAENQDWYQGTADAVRKNLRYLHSADEYIIILSGDHLYRMDYRRFFDHHLRSGADITIAVKPIVESEARELGILNTDADGRITAFYEKPGEQHILDDFRVDQNLFRNFNVDPQDRTHVASMGIYIFNKQALFDLLDKTTEQDFGKEIIPQSLENKNVSAFFFDGYWEDIGNISSFFKAHMDLTESIPQFNFYDETYPFFTRPRYLPASKISQCQISRSILAEGSILMGSKIENSTIGIRALVEEGTSIQRSIIMGNTRYETLEERITKKEKDIPHLGIGTNCVIKNAIVDMDACIGNEVQLINKEQVTETSQNNYVIREGIIIIPKGAVIEKNTVI